MSKSNVGLSTYRLYCRIRGYPRYAKKVTPFFGAAAAAGPRPVSGIGI